MPDEVPPFLKDKHAQYLLRWGQDKNEHDYVMSEYLRMSGLYWSMTALDLLHARDGLDKAGILAFVQESYHPECGGFSAAPGHDPHLLYTLSAIQIVVSYNALDTVDTEKVAKYVAGLQQEDGSFTGDKWGEIDTRFSFCALATLALIGKLDSIHVDAAVAFVLKCMNFDGGFGRVPGSETHSAQVYCCVGSLAITGQLHKVDCDLLGWWLCMRQLPSGGLNGRPEKLPDVCYSWWVLSSLRIIGRLHWINKDKLVKFILACQDDEDGGIADRPGDMVDPFHTLFGVAALSLLHDDTVKDINPIFCMPQEIITEALGGKY